jgi:anti-sigma-K factor RskA
MNHQEWLGQADIYALGALDGDELTAFEAHLAAGCADCEHQIRTAREALTLLPRSLTPVAPSPSVRERALAQIAAEAPMPRPVARLPRQRWWAIGVRALVAAGLLIALSYNLYHMQQELQHERGVIVALRAELAQRDATLQAEHQEVQRMQALVASLQSAIAEREEALQAEQQEHRRAADMVAALQAELARRESTLEAERRELQRVERVVATLRDELDARDVTLRQLSAPQVRLVRLAGLAPSPGASAQLLWNPATRTGMLLTAGLRQIPRDRVYELWAIAGNEPVPAGIFEVDEAGHAFLRLPPLPRTRRFDKFAVTLEPAGGVPKPTGPMHLLGSL